MEPCRIMARSGRSTEQGGKRNRMKNRTLSLSRILQVEEQAVIAVEGRGDPHLGTNPLPTGWVSTTPAFVEHQEHHWTEHWRTSQSATAQINGTPVCALSTKAWVLESDS